MAIFAVAILVALFAPCFGMIWDGGFPNIEYRLRFVDPDGRPVPDVRLEVVTRAGDRCYLYPVNEFVPDRPVVSDTDGWMMFHHDGSYVEFSGHESSNLVGMRFGETESPRYDCVFRIDGREVHRMRFDTIREGRYSELPEVVRTWNRSEWAKNLESITDSTNRHDRELSTALHYFQRSRENSESIRIGFRVVERTIVLPSR